MGGATWKVSHCAKQGKVVSTRTNIWKEHVNYLKCLSSYQKPKKPKVSGDGSKHHGARGQDHQIFHMSVERILSWKINF